MQHVIFVVAGILAFLVPDVPQSVKNEIQREKLLAAEALNSAQEKSGIVQVRGKLVAMWLLCTCSLIVCIHAVHS